MNVSVDLLAAALDCRVKTQLTFIPVEVKPDPETGHFNKRPLVKKLGPLYDTALDEATIRNLFASAPNANAMAVLTGNGLLMIDFDAGGRAFTPWCEKVPEELLARLVIESTVSGGYHVYIRSSAATMGNDRLAYTADGKILIETRCAHALSVCAPTPGYRQIRGSLADIPTLTPDEMKLLLDTARSFNERASEPPRAPTAARSVRPSFADSFDDRPGTDFNRRGQKWFLDWLCSKGWKVTRQDGDNTHLCRPGKSQGTSATFNGQTLYVFSTSVVELPAENAYTPFDVYARLEHGGDFKAAAADLRQKGYGGLSAYVSGESDASADPVAPTGPEDPGRIDPDLLRVPGLMSAIADYTEATSPRHCPVFAATGAICFVAHLAGLARCKTVYGDRPNVYTLMLGPSASGKSFAQRTNRKLAQALGIGYSMISNVGSGQGLEDSFINSPKAVLFTLDEMQKFLGAMRGCDRTNGEGISKTLLELYSASNDVYYTRRLSLSNRGRQQTSRPDFFENPQLTVHASGIAEMVFQNLTVDNLTDGLLGRFLLTETDVRGEVNEDGREIPVPLDLLKSASLLIAGQNAPGMFPFPWQNQSPKDEGRIVPLDGEAEALRKELTAIADANFKAACGDDRVAAQALWGRAVEKAMKLALVFAVSASPEKPVITADLLGRAWKIAEHSTRRLLNLAEVYTARNQYDEMSKRVLRHLREARRPLTKSVLLRKMRESKKAIDPVLETLAESGQIVVRQETERGVGRPALLISLAAA